MLKVKRPRKKLEETEGEGEEILDPDDPDFEAEFNAACDRAAQAIDDWNPEDSDLRGSHIAAMKQRGKSTLRAHSFGGLRDRVKRRRSGENRRIRDLRRAGGCSAFPDPPDFFFCDPQGIRSDSPPIPSKR